MKNKILIAAWVFMGVVYAIGFMTYGDIIPHSGALIFFMGVLWGFLGQIAIFRNTQDVFKITDHKTGLESPKIEYKVTLNNGELYIGPYRTVQDASMAIIEHCVNNGIKKYRIISPNGYDLI